MAHQAPGHGEQALGATMAATATEAALTNFQPRFFCSGLALTGL